MWKYNAHSYKVQYFISYNSKSLPIQIIMWHLPCLAHPAPLRLAIHWARRSSLSSLSTLPETSRLLAASLACGEITPTLEIRHWACALTIQVLRSLLYCPTITLNWPSISGLPVDRQRCPTLISAQVWISEWRSVEQSPQAPKLQKNLKFWAPFFSSLQKITFFYSATPHVR